MTSSIFVDTSFYVASLYPADELHEKARAVTRGLRGKLVTTQFIAVELGNHFSTRNRRAFAEFIKILSQSKNTTVLPASPEWVRKGTRL